MGVHSLWDILGPTARPVRLEALSRKRLAVDASIWIYQFLKAVRDGEGNALPNSHIFGFFRRICKLIFYGIRPIFVFDGGAPALKRETIRRRRERREGQAVSTRQTAQQLLAIQLKRRAELEHSNAKATANRVAKSKQVHADDGTVYLEDLPVSHLTNTASEVVAVETGPKTFLKQNEYHLPEVKSFKVRADDQRIMPDDEYAASQEVDFDFVDGIDVNTVDPKSKEFEELPIATRYMILANLRLKSRLRLGYRKDQLEDLFPNSMDFSKFQIQQVQKRNFYTQLLMHVSGMGGDATLSEKRIAGDKDRKYALVKNDNGWTLALQGDNSSADNPVVLDDYNGDAEKDPVRKTGQIANPVVKPEHEITAVQLGKHEDSDSEFEDVPLEEVPENELEKRYQQAIIESIYDQYQPSTSTNLLEGHSSNSETSGLIPSTGKPLEISRGLLAKSALFSGVEANASSKDPDESDVIGLTTTTSLDPQLKPIVGGLMASSLLFSGVSADKVVNYHESGPAGQVGDATTHINEKDRIEMVDDVPLERYETRKEKPEIPKSRSKFTSQPGTATVDDPKLTSDETFVDENLLAQEASRPGPEKGHLPKLATALPEWFDNNSGPTSRIHDGPALAELTETQERRAENDTGLISWSEANEYLEKEKDLKSQEMEKAEIFEIDDEPIPEVQPHTETTLSPTPSINDVQPDLRGTRKVSLLDYDFEEDEEKNLVKQLAQEEADHESFKERIGSRMPPAKAQYRSEQSLQQQHNRATRDSDEVTQTMITDVQELLKKFGIPFITAPMEAEAQCAELFHLGLVDGIITDDSDCFLFGGSKVYKNMFNQKQYVECYMMEDIEAKLGLDQTKLIELALLLGSDYTEGIKSIGPVLAVEILAEFGTLKAFKSWYDENAKSILSSNTSEMTSVRKTLTNRMKGGKLFLGDNFPDAIVSSAYTHAEVDGDTTEFVWGEPSLDQIRSYLMTNFLWEQARVDEVMVPLIRDLNKRKAVGTQSTIGEFFPELYMQSRKEANLGKRLQTATSTLNKRTKKV